MSYLILSLVFTGCVSSFAVLTAEGCRPAAVKPWRCDRNFASRQASNAFFSARRSCTRLCLRLGRQPMR